MNFMYRIHRLSTAELEIITMSKKNFKAKWLCFRIESNSNIFVVEWPTGIGNERNDCQVIIFFVLREELLTSPNTYTHSHVFMKIYFNVWNNVNNFACFVFLNKDYHFIEYNEKHVVPILSSSISFKTIPCEGFSLCKKIHWNYLKWFSYR